MAATVRARLARAKELHRAQGELDAARQEDRIDRVTALKRTVSAIRADLLGRRPPGLGGAEVMDASGTAWRAIDHMEELTTQGASLERRVEDSLILSAVLDFSARVATTTGIGSGDVGVAKGITRIDYDAKAFNEGQHDRFRAIGTTSRSSQTLEALEAAAMAFLEASEAAKKKTATVKGELLAEFNDICTQREGESRADYNERRYYASLKFKDKEAAANGEYVAAITQAKQAYAAPAQKVADEILAASPVSPAQAQAWAAGQTITKAAATRLKKSGYPADKVRTDMAEFYRLTGGRLRTVVINTDGSRRANAEGIHGHGSATINIDGNFTKRTLWHEMGHHLEADPAILAAARGFLTLRSDGTGLHYLSKLTGNNAYRANEKAYRDGFFSAYVGKHYKDATEVMSMAMESFSDPALLGERMHQDPDIFSLVEGIMKTAENPLMQLIHDVRAENADATKEQQEAESAVREEATREVAARIALQTDEPPANPGALKWFRSYYSGSYGVTEMVGYVVSGTSVYTVWRGTKCKEWVRATASQTRARKGFVITRMDIADTDNFMGEVSFDRAQMVGTNVDDAKVAVYRWINSGITPMAQPSLTELKSYASSRN